MESNSESEILGKVFFPLHGIKKTPQIFSLT